MRRRRHWWLALVLSAPLLGGSIWPERDDAHVHRGERLYLEGRYGPAAAQFRKALSGEARHEVVQFNLGTALLAQALEENSEDERKRVLQLGMVALRRAMATPDERLRRKVRYNLGNAQVSAGLYEHAIASYRGVLAAEPGHVAASHNLEVAELLMKRAEEAGTGNGTSGAEGGNGDADGASEAGADGNPTSDATSELSGQGGASTSKANKGTVEGSQEDGAEPGPGIRAEPRSLSLPSSVDASRVDDKLRALERRSGELRRLRVLRRSEAIRRARELSERGP